jgi:hypothetical protein
MSVWTRSGRGTGWKVGSQFRPVARKQETLDHYNQSTEDELIIKPLQNDDYTYLVRFHGELMHKA